MAKKNTVMDFVTENLPAIFTTVSIITGIGTAVGGVVAGYKVRKKLEELPEGTDSLIKVKKAAPYIVPVVIGATFSAGFCYAAHKENTKRLIVATGAVAALKADKEHLTVVKDKAKEMLGEKKSEELEEKVAEKESRDVETKLGAQPGQIVKIRDLETGHEFKTTFRDFFKSVNRINDICQTNDVSMRRFYQMVEGDKYEPASLHSTIGFGYDCGITNFRPEFGTELGPNLEPIYTINYDYSNLESEARTWDDGDADDPEDD